MTPKIKVHTCTAGTRTGFPVMQPVQPARAVTTFRIAAAGEGGHRERMQPRTKIDRPLQLADESREQL
jgi:hypothetical protein